MAQMLAGASWNKPRHLQSIKVSERMQLTRDVFDEKVQENRKKVRAISDVQVKQRKLCYNRWEQLVWAVVQLQRRQPLMPLRPKGDSCEERAMFGVATQH